MTHETSGDGVFIKFNLREQEHMETGDGARHTSTHCHISQCSIVYPAYMKLPSGTL